MTVLNGLAAGGCFAYALADHDRANGRCGGLGQLFAGFVRDVGAAVQLGLARCQVHGKGKAGGNPAFLAVGLGQEFEYLNTG
jgi:hypothetical protein